MSQRGSLTFLDLRNAEHRAEWTRRYFSGHWCDDFRSTEERECFERWYRERLARAWRFLEGDSGYHH